MIHIEKSLSVVSLQEFTKSLAIEVRRKTSIAIKYHSYF